MTNVIPNTIVEISIDAQTAGSGGSGSVPSPIPGPCDFDLTGFTSGVYYNCVGSDVNLLQDQMAAGGTDNAIANIGPTAIKNVAGFKGYNGRFWDPNDVSQDFYQVQNSGTNFTNSLLMTFLFLVELKQFEWSGFITRFGYLTDVSTTFNFFYNQPGVNDDKFRMIMSEQGGGGFIDAVSDTFALSLDTKYLIGVSLDLTNDTMFLTVNGASVPLNQNGTRTPATMTAIAENSLNDLVIGGYNGSPNVGDGKLAGTLYRCLIGGGKALTVAEMLAEAQKFGLA